MGVKARTTTGIEARTTMESERNTDKMAIGKSDTVVGGPRAKGAGAIHLERGGLKKKVVLAKK